MTSTELQQRYDLQTQLEANEISELKFWPINKLSDLLNPSERILPLTPNCYVTLRTYCRLFF
jgi:hypothetical protein